MFKVPICDVPLPKALIPYMFPLASVPSHLQLSILPVELQFKSLPPPRTHCHWGIWENKRVEFKRRNNKNNLSPASPKDRGFKTV